MTVWLDVNPELLSEDAGVVSAEYLHMTDAQLNMVADALDFAIQPNVPTQADVDAQAAPPQGFPNLYKPGIAPARGCRLPEKNFPCSRSRNSL